MMASRFARFAPRSRPRARGCRSRAPFASRPRLRRRAPAPTVRRSRRSSPHAGWHPCRRPPAPRTTTRSSHVPRAAAGRCPSAAPLRRRVADRAACRGSSRRDRARDAARPARARCAADVAPRRSSATAPSGAALCAAGRPASRRRVPAPLAPIPRCAAPPSDARRARSATSCSIAGRKRAFAGQGRAQLAQCRGTRQFAVQQQPGRSPRTTTARPVRGSSSRDSAARRRDRRCR